MSVTHHSLVFFAGDRAYKLKKPVALGFLDFTRREDRELNCHREVELNRRLAPDVYLGVADIFGPDGRPCDHLVVMRRMPDDRRLSTLLVEGADLAAPLRELARSMATFHASAGAGPQVASAATRDAVLANWEESFAEMASFEGTVLDRETASEVKTLARRYLAGRRPLFEQRITDGYVRDGHGDLLAEDIFLLDDGPRILDCLEFSERYRHGDVLSDMAFLAMDLEYRGAPDLARRLLGWYDEAAGQPSPASLADHYIAYRAHVRAKVACIRHAQGDESAAGEAARLLDLSVLHLRHARVAVILVGGSPGTGKTTLAAGLARERGWRLFGSDDLRRDRARLPHEPLAAQPFGTGLYSPEQVSAVYADLVGRARQSLERGQSVVLDASWRRQEWRRWAEDLARETSSELLELRCIAPERLAVSRLLRRRRKGTGTSDATPAIAHTMAASFEPWPTAVQIDTTGRPSRTLATALAAIARPAPRGER